VYAAGDSTGFREHQLFSKDNKARPQSASIKSRPGLNDFGLFPPTRPPYTLRSQAWPDLSLL